MTSGWSVTCGAGSWDESLDMGLDMAQDVSLLHCIYMEPTSRRSAGRARGSVPGLKRVYLSCPSPGLFSHGLAWGWHRQECVLVWKNLWHFMFSAWEGIK